MLSFFQESLGILFPVQVKIALCSMPVPASRVPMMAAAPTGMADSIVPVHQGTRAAPVGMMWMNVGCPLSVNMGVLALTRLAHSAASASLATLDSSVRASPHLVLPLSV